MKRRIKPIFAEHIYWLRPFSYSNVNAQNNGLEAGVKILPVTVIVTSKGIDTKHLSINTGIIIAFVYSQCTVDSVKPTCQITLRNFCDSD